MGSVDWGESDGEASMSGVERLVVTGVYIGGKSQWQSSLSVWLVGGVCGHGILPAAACVRSMAGRQ